MELPAYRPRNYPLLEEYCKHFFFQMNFSQRHNPQIFHCRLLPASSQDSAIISQLSCSFKTSSKSVCTAMSAFSTIKKVKNGNNSTKFLKGYQKHEAHTDHHVYHVLGQLHSQALSPFPSLSSRRETRKKRGKGDRAWGRGWCWETDVEEIKIKIK